MDHFNRDPRLKPAPPPRPRPDRPPSSQFTIEVPPGSRKIISHGCPGNTYAFVTRGFVSDSISAHNDDYGSHSKRFGDVERKIEEITGGDLPSLTADVAALKNDTKALFASVDELDSATEALSGDIKTVSDGLSERIDSTEEALSNRISSTETSLSGKIDSTEKALSDKISLTESSLSGKIDSTEDALSKKISSTETSLSNRISSTETTLSGKISSTEASLNSRIDSATESLSGDIKAVSDDLSERIDSNDADISSIKTTLEGKQDSLFFSSDFLTAGNSVSLHYGNVEEGGQRPVTGGTVFSAIPKITLHILDSDDGATEKEI